MKKEIRVNDISFSYGDTSFIENFSVVIREGEYVAIVGANGSGKTTFSRLISGVLHPQRGTIRINGKELFEENGTVIPESRAQVSVVLQNPEDQFVGSNVREDIAFGLENMAVPREKMDDIIHRVAAETGIEAFLNKEPNQLSGGQKQRVAIASTLALETAYMIFDEATSQLDPQGKQEVMEAIEEVAHKKNKTVILVTHDLEEVLRAERVLVFSEGKIVIDTTPADLFNGGYDLEKYHLVLPQVLQYSRRLKELGLIDETHMTLEGVARDLCK